MPRLIEAEDDGLALPQVQGWAERKYRLIATQTEIFARSMYRKWQTRVYVDLFAGAGRARLKSSRRVVATSATLALGVSHPFDRYVFCDSNRVKAAALEKRIRRDFRNANATVLLGDCNTHVDRILEMLPARGSLTFCLVDPYNLGTLRFATIEKLAVRSVDFLILIASHMDGNRNRKAYTRPGNRTVEALLAMPEWRTEWERLAQTRGAHDFGTFLVDQFGRRMRTLGYLYEGLTDTLPVAHGRRKLYHLTFFSRHKLGRKFWSEALRHSTDQLDLL